MPSELREALTAAGASALIPKIIDPLLLEYQRRYSPLVRLIPSEKWNSDTYYFNQRTVNPAGGFVTDGGARPVTNSTYVQNSFPMKHLQVVGAVTGYAQEVTRQVIGDLRAREIEGSIKGLYWDIETAMLWGNLGSTQYGPYPQFDGFDSQINVYSGSTQNAIDKAGSTLTLAFLDELIDMVETNAAVDVFNESWMLVMSNTTQSKVAQLLTNQQRFMDKIEVEAGLIVPTYRGIPFQKSSFFSTRGYSLGAVTTTTATTGGVILDATTYKYRLSAVISRQGEIAASTEVSQTTGSSGSNTNIITAAFTPPTGNDGLAPQLYKVYRSTTAGAETLLGYVDAVVGVGSDGVTPVIATSIIDTGATLIPQNGSTLPANYPATYVGTSTSKYPPAVGQENIFFVSRDADNIVRPYVRELTPLDVYPTTTSPDSLPYAIASDTTLAIRGPKFLGGMYRVNIAV